MLLSDVLHGPGYQKKHIVAVLRSILCVKLETWQILLASLGNEIRLIISLTQRPRAYPVTLGGHPINA